MRVNPILKYGLIAGALALPGAAYPLGLGRLTVESFVGQPLVARIELLSSSKDELDTLAAKIADPSLYRQNNLQYQAVLSRTRITLERGTGDTAFLKVTSGAPVSEPYLDLLVEVTGMPVFDPVLGRIANLPRHRAQGERDAPAGLRR